MAGSGKESAKRKATGGTSKTEQSERLAEETALLDTGDEGCCGCFGGLARALRRRFAPRDGGRKQGWMRRASRLLSRKKGSPAASPTNTPAGRMHVDDCGPPSPCASPCPTASSPIDGTCGDVREFEGSPQVDHSDGEGTPGIVKATPSESHNPPHTDADLPPEVPQLSPTSPVTVQIRGTPVHLEQLLGQGAYGGVFRIQAAAGGSLAIKLTRVPAHNKFEAILKRAENAISYAHDGLIQTHAVSPADVWDCATETIAARLFGPPNLVGCGLFWTLMEHGGPNLNAFYAQRVNGRRSADAAEGTRWCSTLFDAVAYLHEKGLCHRDIKTDNVLVKTVDCSSRKLLIIDLEDVAPAAEKQNRRTLYYQDWHVQDAPMPSDVWATAMVAHFVLTEGHLPAGIAQALQDPSAELHPPQGVPAVLHRLRPCWVRNTAIRPTAATARGIFTQEFAEGLEQDQSYLAAHLVPPDEKFLEFKRQYEDFIMQS